MALPGITSVTILDGSLGIAPENTTGIHVKLGQCTSGVFNQLGSFSSVQDVKQTLGTGELVKAMATGLDIAGGPIYAMRLQTSIAGITGVIQAALVTTPVASDGVLALTGSSPLDDYQFTVRIVRTGKVGVAPYPTFQYSLDNGLTFSEETVIPSGGVIAISGTGMTFTFTNGANGFFAGDTWYFQTTSPTWNNADLSAGLTALLADARTWGFIHLVGPADTTIFSTVAAYMTTASTNERYVHTIIEAREFDWTADLISGTNVFPMTFAGGETLKINVSTDFGLTFPTTKTFTFPAIAYANIAALVAALNVQSFTGGLFSVSSVAATLVLSTLSIKGQVVLRVDPTSTGIGALLVNYTASQSASGETEDTWMNSLITAFTPAASDRVSVFAGPCDIYSSADRQYNIRNGAWIMSGREGLIPISEDLGKVARGPLPLILVPDISKQKYGIYHDEGQKPGLDVSRFSTTRTFRGLPGFYITNGRTFANPGSDFTYLQFRRVIDRAATLLTTVIKQYINTEVRVNANGTIAEIDARAIEDRVLSYMYNQLKDNVTAIEVEVDRTINIVQTQTLKVTCAIQPFGYAKFITLVLGFVPTITA